MRSSGCGSECPQARRRRDTANCSRGGPGHHWPRLFAGLEGKARVAALYQLRIDVTVQLDAGHVRGGKIVLRAPAAIAVRADRGGDGLASCIRSGLLEVLRHDVMRLPSRRIVGLWQCDLLLVEIIHEFLLMQYQSLA